MDNYPKILFKALQNVLHQKDTWLLAFLQVMCLFFIFSKTTLFSIRVLLYLVLIILFSLVTIILWKKIQAFEEKKQFALQQNVFWSLTLKVCGFLLLAMLFMLGFKVLKAHWTVFSVLGCLVGVSTTISMLFAVLYNLSFHKSLKLLGNFWQRKTSLVCWSAFVVILGNAYAFYLAHTIWPEAETRDFSVFSSSATIWLVFLALAVIAAFFSALINAFIVLLFLEATGPKKDTEQVPATQIQPVAHL